MLEAAARPSSEGASKNIGTAGWGLLLIWTGAALLLHWSWGVGLIGAGVIVLGAQLARWYLRLKPEALSTVAGVVLLTCGLGEMWKVTDYLFPVLFIAAGVALLASIWTARQRHATGAPPDVEPHTQPRG